MSLPMNEESATAFDSLDMLAAASSYAACEECFAYALLHEGICLQCYIDPGHKEDN
jgi:hypothetical protein